MKEPAPWPRPPVIVQTAQYRIVARGTIGAFVESRSTDAAGGERWLPLETDGPWLTSSCRADWGVICRDLVQHAANHGQPPAIDVSKLNLVPARRTWKEQRRISRELDLMDPLFAFVVGTFLGSSIWFLLWAAVLKAAT